MKSFITSAVLGAAALAQAASVHHAHQHRHVAVEKRTPVVQLTAAADALLAEKKILVGKNSETDCPVKLGGNGPFLVEFENHSKMNVVVTVWSGSQQPGTQQEGAWKSMFIGAAQPDITTSLESGCNTTVSFNPALAPNNKISGGFGAIFPHNGLSPITGQLNETFGEYTFTNQDEFSTTDVSRLINMRGRRMEIHNYRLKTDAKPLCSSTMDKCSFHCPEGMDTCPGALGRIVNCPVGTPYTTSSADAADGGCGGLSSTGGYIKVDIY